MGSAWCGDGGGTLEIRSVERKFLSALFHPRRRPLLDLPLLDPSSHARRPRRFCRTAARLVLKVVGRLDLQWKGCVERRNARCVFGDALVTVSAHAKLGGGACVLSVSISNALLLRNSVL